MRTRILLMFSSLLVLIFISLSVSGGNESQFNRPIPKRMWTQQARIWGARSVVGEVGWGDKKNPQEAINEWVAVMNVYGTRAVEHRTSLKYMIKKYSHAVQARSTHRRPWILGLNARGTEPAGWPSRLKWSNHKPIWMRVLTTVDMWANGEVKSLTPDANHYGGDMDAHRAKSRCWGMVNAPAYFGNTFYNSKWRRPNCRITVRDVPRVRVKGQYVRVKGQYVKVPGVDYSLVEMRERLDPPVDRSRFKR